MSHFFVDTNVLLAVDSRNVNDALRSSFADFEDALQYFAATAKANGAMLASEPVIEAIITRDPKGFATGTLLVLTPPQALGRLAS